MDGEAVNEGVLFILADGEGRLLLQLRDHEPGIYRPGVWAVPGGAIEDNESPLEAALREVLEETGQRVERLYPFGEAQRGNHTVHIFCGGAGFPEEEIVVGEGQAFNFFNWDEIERLEPISPVAAPLIESFLSDPLYKRCRRDAQSSGRPPA